MARIKEMTEHYVNDFIKRSVSISNLGYCRININQFANIADEIAIRSLSKILCLVSNQEIAPRLSKIITLLDNIKNNTQIDITIHQCQVIFVQQDSDIMYICKEVNFLPNITNNTASCIQSNDSKNITLNKEIFTNYLHQDIMQNNEYYLHEISPNNSPHNAEITFHIRYIDQEILKEIGNPYNHLQKKILYSLPIIYVNNNNINNYYYIIDNLRK